MAEFLSTPSGWRATTTDKLIERWMKLYFYPRPPGGGRHPEKAKNAGRYDFYPRPPGGGRLPKAAWRRFQPNFYPRPPGGGRLPAQSRGATSLAAFLSTPSGWRATCAQCGKTIRDGKFLSTPSGWRATTELFGPCGIGWISIHALRVEGDGACEQRRFHGRDFYPRPPGGGRPRSGGSDKKGDHFYPRPPGGGRHAATSAAACSRRFLSTPSGWRATKRFKRLYSELPIFLSTPSGWRATSSSCKISAVVSSISIHALRVEGDSQLANQVFKCDISIHALRVEGDLFLQFLLS